MTIALQVLSARVPRIQVLIVLVSLFELRHCPIIVANAFTPLYTGAKKSHSTFRYIVSRQQKTRPEIPRTGLCAHGREIIIRDWRLTDNEPQKIYDFLLQREQDERKMTTNFFDPEGSLDLDVLNEVTLEESYSEENGGCFLVAVEGESIEDGDDDSVVVVGTLGMISGTQVSYQTSGSSFSKPEITAALRRVCATKALEKEPSATLKALIRQGEQRALQSGATNLIALAHSEVAVVGDHADYDESKSIAKPTVSLLESLGYRVSEQQIPGVTTIQYEKKLFENQHTTEAKTVLESTTITTEDGRWVLPVTIATIISLGVLVFNLYTNVFGIEQLWGSVDNGGIGTSLSSQNLEELIRDEKLGRSGLDDGIGSATVRQWEDLSPEELREEQALMKVIQGQSIRSK